VRIERKENLEERGKRKEERGERIALRLKG